MTTEAWSDDDLARIGRAEEMQIASLRGDGTLRPYVTIWAVQVGDVRDTPAAAAIKK